MGEVCQLVAHASGKPTVEVIFTVLHAGGNLDKVDIKLLEDFMVLVLP